MINLRYHIVSITAVFLALGIGLAFGAAFIDRATVSVLNDNVDAVEQQNQELEADNQALRDRVDEADDVEAQLREQGLTQLVAGRLTAVPVVVLATRGIDEAPVEALRDALVASGAQTPGVLWLTDRLVLDDENEVDDLATALGETTTDVERLRRTLLRQLGALLADAAQPAPVDGAIVEPRPDNPGGALMDALLAAEFLQLDPAGGTPSAIPVAPGGGVRIVVVSGPDPVIPADELLVPMLRNISQRATAGTSGPIAVAAQSAPVAGSIDDDAEEAAARVAFVGPLRDEDGLRERISTVDGVESFAGLVATILALQHGGSGQYGHYGVGDGVQSLLPPDVVPS